MTAPIDYNAVLADLEAKRAQIDSAIAVIRALIGAGAGSGGGDVQAPADVLAATDGAPFPATQLRPSGTPGIASDTFFRLSTADAIKKYLGITKRPQTARAIADALMAGGQVHATDERVAYANVHTALTRGKDKVFAQTRNKDWGLAEWYGSNKPKESE